MTSKQNDTKIDMPYKSIEDLLKKSLLLSDSGYIKLSGVNVCFFKVKDADRVQVIFPFKIFEYSDNKIADNPHHVLRELLGYIIEMKDCTLVKYE